MDLFSAELYGAHMEEFRETWLRDADVDIHLFGVSSRIVPVATDRSALAYRITRKRHIKNRKEGNVY